MIVLNTFSIMIQANSNPNNIAFNFFLLQHQTQHNLNTDNPFSSLVSQVYVNPPGVWTWFETKFDCLNFHRYSHVSLPMCLIDLDPILPCKSSTALHPMLFCGHSHTALSSSKVFLYRDCLHFTFLHYLPVSSQHKAESATLTVLITALNMQWESSTGTSAVS